ncbi:MAG: riboflavin synthase [Nitrospinaceae bacterium]
MFSGIIQSLGTVDKITHREERAEMVVRTEPGFTGFELGESVAVNGVCLTVRDAGENFFCVDLSTETLNRTSFKETKTACTVNLERALTPSQKISGHFVSGHIDQVGTVVEITPKPGEVLFRLEHSPEISPFIIEKGSIALDGISLTVFSCRDNQFSVSIIPYTLRHTNLNARKIGDRVNLECDMIGKYVIKACETILSQPSQEKKLSLDLLRQNGFL